MTDLWLHNERLLLQHGRVIGEVGRALLAASDFNTMITLIVQDLTEWQPRAGTTERLVLDRLTKAIEDYERALSGENLRHTVGPPNQHGEPNGHQTR